MTQKTPVTSPVKLAKKDIRYELYKKSASELEDTIAYHQAKASANQRIVAIAKLILKSKQKDTIHDITQRNIEALAGSIANDKSEQHSDSSDIGGDK